MYKNDGYFYDWCIKKKRARLGPKGGIVPSLNLKPSLTVSPMALTTEQICDRGRIGDWPKYVLDERC